MTRRGNMAAERARHGLQIADVASAVSVAEETYRRWEQGTSAPSSENLLDISKFYQCTPEYLLKATESKEDFLLNARKRIGQEGGND